jgi:multidrug/hemolysin transport system ATP-binding protein
MLLETKNLTKKYGNYLALNRVNLAIPKGTLVAYLGTNGAGKSTTIKLLTGLLEPTDGEIKVKKGLKMGIVFQNSVLDDELTVRENLIIRAKLEKGVTKSWIEELIQLTGLANFLNQRYKTLSGGQRRRVDIARALLKKPDLLFLDEPTTGLDLQTRKTIWKLIDQLRIEQGLSIFLTTHYLEEAENAEKIYVLANGKILATGSVDELVNRFAQSRLILNTKNQDVLVGATKIETNIFEFRGLTWQEAYAKINANQIDLINFEYNPGNLNDAFLKITGKQVR